MRYRLLRGRLVMVVMLAHDDYQAIHLWKSSAHNNNGAESVTTSRPTRRHLLRSDRMPGGQHLSDWSSTSDCGDVRGSSETHVSSKVVRTVAFRPRRRWVSNSLSTQPF